MSFLSKIFGVGNPAASLGKDWIVKDMTCGHCSRGMTVVLGLRIAGAFPMGGEQAAWLMALRPKGSFQCAGCEVCYCWDCSDMERTCSCGSKGVWRAVQYFDR